MLSPSYHNLLGYTSDSKYICLSHHVYALAYLGMRMRRHEYLTILQYKPIIKFKN